MPFDPLQQLSVIDPELAKTLGNELERKKNPASTYSVALLADETMWGLSVESSFGCAIAKGYVGLIGATDTEDLLRYRLLVRGAGADGPALGKIMATCLVPVLKYGDFKLLEIFLKAVDIMQKKTAHTLKSLLSPLTSLLESKEIESGTAYLDLLCAVFSQNLTYNQYRHFSNILPGAVLSFSASKRVWQIKSLQKIITAAFNLADSFLEGLDKGLSLLSKEALNDFVSMGLDKYGHNQNLGTKFLSLESKLGIDTFEQMQVTVPFFQVQRQLNRYLRARTGLAISVLPQSLLPKLFYDYNDGMPQVCSDGNHIYLPDEISVFAEKKDNLNLYKYLAKLEAGHYEFNTFDFDFEKFRDIYGIDENCRDAVENKNLSDLERFFTIFPINELASDLFIIFEHGRIRVMLSDRYPGLVRQVLPVFQNEAKRIYNKDIPFQAVFLLYMRIALDVWPVEFFSEDCKIKKQIDRFADLFETGIKKKSEVETCADFVSKTYYDMETLLKHNIGDKNLEESYRPVRTPFGRRLKPDLYFSTFLQYERMAKKIKVVLKENGFDIYRSQIRKSLIKNKGSITSEDIKEIIICSPKKKLPHESQDQDQKKNIDLKGLDFAEILGSTGLVPVQCMDSAGTVFRYKEWDCNLDDYLKDHVRVLDRTMIGISGNFYKNTLKSYPGLVKKMRHMFEMLKPEDLSILRQWTEGDEFDYRALLDFAIDKKAGIIPSDRLYIKRIKHQRDVAAMLLVDLSRSTSNTVFGSHKTVLEVEKEAIVLFCEALEVVGDKYAIAGFSGTGRLGVDYFHIKDFDEIMDDNVRQRIIAMTPQRNTRIGAAIRHAAYQLENVPSKLRLMIILSDGFPNDIDYKQQYAIEDTRKAIFEARSKNIHAKAITVNIASDSRLDDLYGHLQHNVISDITQLPDKLLRIYSALTR